MDEAKTTEVVEVQPPQAGGEVESLQTLQWCAYCAGMVPPYTEPGAGGMSDAKTDCARPSNAIARCPVCLSPTKPTRPTDDVGTTVVGVATPPPAGRPPVAMPIAGPAPPVSPWLMATPTGPATFLDQCRARLVEVEAQRETLKTEAKQLKRLLGK